MSIIEKKKKIVVAINPDCSMSHIFGKIKGFFGRTSIKEEKWRKINTDRFSTFSSYLAFICEKIMHLFMPAKM